MASLRGTNEGRKDETGETIRKLEVWRENNEKERHKNIKQKIKNKNEDVNEESGTVN